LKQYFFCVDHEMSCSSEASSGSPRCSDSGSSGAGSGAKTPPTGGIFTGGRAMEALTEHLLQTMARSNGEEDHEVVEELLALSHVAAATGDYAFSLESVELATDLQVSLQTLEGSVKIQEPSHFEEMEMLMGA